MHKNDLSQAERLSEDTSEPGLGTQSSSIICKGIRNKQAVKQRKIQTEKILWSTCLRNIGNAIYNI